MAVGELLEVAMVLFLFATIIQIAIFAAIVTGVARLVRRGTGPSSSTAQLRHFFTFGLLAAAVAIGAIGVGGLIVRAIEPPLVVAAANADLARSLAFALVGLPVAVVLMRTTLRRLVSATGEAESIAWRIYVTTAMTLSLLAVLISGCAVVGAILGLEEAGAEAMAWCITSAAVWAIHWSRPVRRHHPAAGAHLMLGSLLGLGAVMGGAGAMLGVALDGAYGALFTTELASSDAGESLLRGGIVFGLGALAWMWHWFRPSRSEWSDTLWHGWVLLGGMVPGVLAALSAVGAVLGGVLVWFLGEPGTDAAGVFFDYLPVAVTVGVIGGLAAAYHRAVHAAAVDSRVEPARAYEYLLAAVGLFAALSGVTTLLVAFFGTLTSSPVAGDESSVNVLLAAVVAVGLGAPLWMRFWRRADRVAQTVPDVELASPTRRGYVLVILGVAGIVGLISTISMVFVLLEDVLDGTVGAGTLYDMRVSLALVLTTGLAAGYHWNVFRRDQRLRPEAEAPPKRVVLVTRPGSDFVQQLEAVIGAPVDRWEMLGRGTAEALDAAAVAAAVGEAPTDDVLVIVGGDGTPVVVPFRAAWD